MAASQPSMSATQSSSSSGDSRVVLSEGSSFSESSSEVFSLGVLSSEGLSSGESLFGVVTKELVVLFLVWLIASFSVFFPSLCSMTLGLGAIVVVPTLMSLPFLLGKS